MLYLVWHCHNEQHSVICAKTMKGVIETFKVALEKHADAKPVAFYDMVEVEKPQLFFDIVAAKEKFDTISSWAHHIAYLIKEKHGGFLDQFKSCPKEKEHWASGNPDPFGCTLCFNTDIILTGTTWEKLHERAKVFPTQL